MALCTVRWLLAVAGSMVATGSAASLRASTAPNASNASGPTGATPADLAEVVAKAAALTAPPPAAAQAHSGRHSKLDVGFKGFEADAEAAVLGALVPRLPSSLAAAAREEFNHTVSLEIQARFNASVAATKASVAKHWMELKDEKRDSFVAQLKNRFSDIFESHRARFAHRASVDFFTEKDLPPQADDAHVRLNIDRLMNHSMVSLTKQLDDYTEMFYMSSIFLGYRVKASKKMLSLVSKVTLSVE